ncbi:MAG: DUF423 domain-containing protein [Pseudomonadota bacterium]
MIRRLLFGLAGLNGAAGVIFAAMGAHGPLAGTNLTTASTMQLIHASAALAILAALSGRGGTLAAALLLVGAGLFATALYVGTLTPVSLGPVAPVGGLLMIAGWLAIIPAALIRRKGKAAG